MKQIGLNGVWSLTDNDRVENIPAQVPGCNFLDLMRAEIIPDPFLGCNEKAVQWVGEHNWIYTRTFEVAPEILDAEKCELVFEMLDTLAEISVNGKEIGTTQNAYRRYVFDVKDALTEGENTISVKFLNCLEYIAQWQKAMPMLNTTEGEAGSCHIRKPAYHFGWDWAPHLLQCGMIKPVYIEAYNGAKLSSVRIRQLHENGSVTLKLSPEFDGGEGGRVGYTLVSPDGEESSFSAAGDAETVITSPRLWWCNGLGDQPLYTLRAYAEDEPDRVLEYTIGLRTIVLDRSKDKYGSNFCFVLNGVKVFAKGANWVPTDSFISRTTRDDIEFLISTAAHANMNMLRVWGGAYYESDDFYDLCDRYGILVWQDCMFACSPFPYRREDFMAEIDAEIADNVTRLRHHASLALWNGNNEIEQMSAAWRFMRDNIKRTEKLFYKRLPAKIAEYDDVTPYHPGSPTGSKFLKRINSPDVGDTHLWKAWHGLRPVSYLLGNYTRFCSEFGFQAFAHENTIRTFCSGELPDALSDPLMKGHQKAMCGNSRTQFYIIDRYWTPERLWDLVYLSQLDQADCAQDATEHWRRNKGRCNGALYWQYNDCWGVTSWAGIDWYRNLKAVTYRAREFNAPVTVTVSLKSKSADFHVVNDSMKDRRFKAVCGFMTMGGENIERVEKEFDCPAQSVIPVASVKNPKGKTRDADTIAYAELYDEQGALISERTRTLVKEKYAELPASPLGHTTSYDGDTYSVTVRANSYARGVELMLDGINAVWSDNFFDLKAGEYKTVTARIDGADKETLDKKLRVRSLADIPRKFGIRADKQYRKQLFFKPLNFINWFYRTFEE